MSEASIAVNKQSIKQFLTLEEGYSFVIPEYQREYAWEEEQVTQLFDDVWDFVQTKLKDTPNTPNEYFLGCVVAYRNAERKEIEIIDGQQRLTTLFLLLRAIYTKLENMTRSNDCVNNFLTEIPPLIWVKDRLSGKVDKAQVLVSSRVITDKKNEVFHEILRTGKVDGKPDDRYSQNYLILQEKVDSLVLTETMHFFEFISRLINQVIVMPIISADPDTAMTIFLTLNNRGLQLSDADIFKAKIYSQLPLEQRDDFIDSWKQLCDEVAMIDLDVQSLFTYHSFYCRAKEGDKDTTRMGVRKYYSWNQYKRLSSPTLMDEIWSILGFWKVIRLHETIEGESWTRNIRILQLFDVLEYYANDFWKYTSISYYLIHGKEIDFERNFLVFLQKQVALLVETYLVTPGANAVKSKLFNLNAAIGKTNQPEYEYDELSDRELYERLLVPKSKIVHMLLALLVYCDGEQIQEFLPRKWQVEHILPKKYDCTYFFSNSKEEIEEMLEHIGNFLPLAKKNNVQASNGFFSKKREIYERSNISFVKNFVRTAPSEWNLETIKQRDKEIIDKLIRILHSLSSGNLTSNSGTNAVVRTENPSPNTQFSSINQPVHPNDAFTSFNQTHGLSQYNFNTRDNRQNTIRRNVTHKAPQTSFRVIFPDGTIICRETAADTLADAINKIGPEKIPQWGLKVHGDEDLVSKFPGLKYPNKDKRLRGGYYLRTNTPTETKVRQLSVLADRLGINIRIETFTK